MKTSFLNRRLDRQWLRETALKATNLPAGFSLPAWRCAVIHGNEDCPQKIELFTDECPDYAATPVACLALQDDGTYKPQESAALFGVTINS